MSEPRADEVFRRLQDRDVVFDFGANLLASGAPVVRLYSKVNDMLAAVGFRRIALVPISTNKPGAVGAAREILRAMSHMECRAVLVNRDNSNYYDGDTSDLKPLKMPHLEPALQDFRAHLQTKLGLSLSDALRSPPDGWHYATDRLGMWLREFATQPFMIDVLGGDIGIVLNGLGRHNHPPLRVTLSSKDDLHDDAIVDYNRLSAFAMKVQRNGVWRILDAHGLTPNGLRAAAEEIERQQAK